MKHKNDSIEPYSNKLLSKKEYKKMISKAKPRYMNDLKNSNKKTKYSEEKYFNNLLSTYYNDYNRLKTKYNLKDEEESDNKSNEYNEKDFITKKNDLNRIISEDLNKIKEYDFNIFDNLFNELPKDNNYSLLKNIQNKEDYELRLQGLNNNKKDFIEKENNNEEDIVNIKEKYNKKNIENNPPEHNIQESIGYLEDNNQFKENNDNYLKLNQQQNEDLPLFNNIISGDYNKNYRVPFYEHDEEDEKEEKKEEEKQNIEEKEDINKLVLENKNKEYMKLEDILKSDFNKEYIIPEYKIPTEIKQEIENNKIEQENKKKIYEENKIIPNNDLIKDNNNNNLNNLQTVKDIIKKDEYDEEGAFVEVDIDEEKTKTKKESENKKENSNEEEFEKVNVDALKEIDDNNYNDNEDKKYNEFN